MISRARFKEFDNGWEISELWDMGHELGIHRTYQGTPTLKYKIKRFFDKSLPEKVHYTRLVKVKDLLTPPPIKPKYEDSLAVWHDLKDGDFEKLVEYVKVLPSYDKDEFFVDCQSSGETET